MPGALCNMGSEPEDVYLYNQAYWFGADTCRRVFIRNDPSVPASPDCTLQGSLLMSPNRLGWYHMEKITDPAVILIC